MPAMSGVDLNLRTVMGGFARTCKERSIALYFGWLPGRSPCSQGTNTALVNQAGGAPAVAAIETQRLVLGSALVNEVGSLGMRHTLTVRWCEEAAERYLLSSYWSIG